MLDLDACLRRGSVFHWNEYDKLDDPSADRKGKFIVVINAFLPGDSLYYLLTTSQVEQLLDSPFRADAVVFEAGAYPFFKKRTAVNVGTAGLTIPADDFRGMYYDGQIEYVGQMCEPDVKRIDTAISRSVRVQKALKRFITAW